MSVSLTTSNFFTNYSLNSFASELSIADQRKAVIISIALGILTGGFFHLAVFIAQKACCASIAPHDPTTRKTQQIANSNLGNTFTHLRGPAESSVAFPGYEKDHLEEHSKNYGGTINPPSCMPKKANKKL